MEQIRVLVVDDSVVIRRLLANTLELEPGITVAGTAANGYLALSRIEALRPDLVTLDIEMPEMDGLSVLRELRLRWPRLPVIMFSTMTERGALATLDALAAGASDYVTKPANMGSVGQAMERIRADLVPRIRALCPGRGDGGTVAPRAPIVRSRPAPPVEVVVIGVSTGGPNALAAVLPALPNRFPVPLVVVQHMPPVFTRLLAARLDAIGAVAVTEAAAGDRLCPGAALIAPGDQHLLVERTAAGVIVRLNREPPENSCRPAVDPLFRSAAAAYGAGVLAVVLTGMGSDGLRGAEAVVGAGGRVWVQDEATAVVWGMPGFVARAGLAERVLPLDHIASALVAAANAGRTPAGTAASVC